MRSVTGRAFSTTPISERNSSWGYRWLFSCWANGGLAIHPNVNLVSNIGFGANATHTADQQSDLARVNTRNMAFPLKHPTVVERDMEADRFTQKHVYGAPSILRRAIRKAGAVVRRFSSRRR